MGFLLRSPASSYAGHVDGGWLRTPSPASTGHASAQREVGRLVLKPPPSVSTLAFRKGGKRYTKALRHPCTNHGWERRCPHRLRASVPAPSPRKKAHGPHSACPCGRAVPRADKISALPAKSCALRGVPFLYWERRCPHRLRASVPAPSPRKQAHGSHAACPCG